MPSDSKNKFATRCGNITTSTVCRRTVAGSAYVGASAIFAVLPYKSMSRGAVAMQRSGNNYKLNDGMNYGIFGMATIAS